ncbi:hypothetical protein ACR780_10670 [Sphingobacterium faecium]|uniref:hypothetical protein n=1 Tax=Sphingobacterium faecium TaxID=34087 RepID=UPI003DA61719
MKTNINWNNIRVINSSQNEGFEELVCQLASREPIKDKVNFTRIGKPDGGKECICVLSTGEIYAWQAKYFTSSFSTSQWSQIDESVKKAIDNHSTLVKYFVCIPLDMPDGKIKNKKSLLDKWKEKVVEWQNYALTKGLSVEFEYWGSYELISKLSIKENEGLTYFWFNQDEFEDSWFEYKNKESIQALGGRYSAELNFELPISRIFSGFSRDETFVEHLQNEFKELLEKYRRISTPKDDVIKESIDAIDENISSMISIFKEFKLLGVSHLDFEEMRIILQKCLELTSNVEEFLYKGAKEKQEKSKTSDYSNPYSMELDSLRKFESAIKDFSFYIAGPMCKLANSPFLILNGEAGSGKSHLLADIVKRRAIIGQQSLLILGENFTSRDMPWTQILHNILRKPGIDELTFLGALNAKAEAQGSRILIVIDAINEGEGRIIWTKRLSSFISLFQNYPWLGLVMSIRNSFVNLIAPYSDVDRKLVTRIEHNGFSDLEYEASKEFFKFYGIIQPSSPLLNPEFQNPLFLKLYCQALRNRGLYDIPAGYQGITAIIASFIDSVDFKLSEPSELYYDIKKSLVSKSVHAILEKMVHSDSDFLDYLVASDTIDNIFKNACTNQEPFLKRLISEGVFNVDMRWDDKGEPKDVIYFAYQRFQDHLIVSMMLDKYLNLENPIQSFKSGKLYELVKDSKTASYNQNIIDSLSIQLPEKIGKELFEVAEHACKYSSIAIGFVNSLIWRKENTIKDSVLPYINNVLIKDKYLFSRFLDVTISTSLKEEHFFNAERLHRYLIKFDLPIRDKIWTIWLQDKFGPESETNAVKRLVDWAWNEDEKSHISDRSIELGCITLIWFFTSSNSYLRDGATKGLICLLQDRQQLVVPLLERFQNINDPYVLERIYAAVYGSAVRSISESHLVNICNAIHAHIFSQDLVYPHFLLRDYARETIEYAVYRGHAFDFKVEEVRPVYKSESLPDVMPTNEEIDEMYMPSEESGNYGGENWGATAIFSSMTTEYGRGGNYGDFGRYVFGYAFDDFNIDVDLLSNYAIQRIFELGYNPTFFSEFDSNQSSGRGGGYERIGKKYQWIVFYELLARVSDEFELYDEAGRSKDKITEFQGPWYPDERNIDPTIVIKQTVQKGSEKNTINWMAPVDYSKWSVDHKVWVTNSNDLPDPKKIVEVTDIQGNQWLVLETQPVWEEEGDIFKDRYEQVRSTLWYQIRSYLVSNSELPIFKKKLKSIFYRKSLPEARNNYTVFSREYYWSPAYDFFINPYYNGEQWVDVNLERDGSKIGKICRTTEYYNWENARDFSKKSTISFYKPTKIISDGLDLHFSRVEGELVDNDGEKICFDPSVISKCIPSLLIRKDKLIKFLEANDLSLIWGLVGEKQISASHWEKGQYPGRMNVWGLFSLENDLVKGKLSTGMEKG